jgi:hypothetical protein
MNKLRKAVARFLRRSANIVSPDMFTDFSWPLIVGMWVVLFLTVFSAGYCSR